MGKQKSTLGYDNERILETEMDKEFKMDWALSLPN